MGTFFNLHFLFVVHMDWGLGAGTSLFQYIFLCSWDCFVTPPSLPH